jgi:hypothetical protein
MGEHLIDGEFQSDKYPTCPRGKVPLSCNDLIAQDLLWEYAKRRRAVDAEFADDLQSALRLAGFVPLSKVQVVIEGGRSSGRGIVPDIPPAPEKEGGR